MSRSSRQWYGAVQIDTRFLQLLGLGLFLCVLDRRSGDGGRGIRIRKAFLGVGVGKTIWVRQALRLLRRLVGHVDIDIRASAALNNGKCDWRTSRVSGGGLSYKSKNAEISSCIVDARLNNEAATVRFDYGSVLVVRVVERQARCQLPPSTPARRVPAFGAPSTLRP